MSVITPTSPAVRASCWILPIARLIIPPGSLTETTTAAVQAAATSKQGYNLTDASRSSLPICALVFVGKRFLGATLLPTRVRDDRQYRHSCNSLPSPEIPIRYHRPVQCKDPTAPPPRPSSKACESDPKKSMDSRPRRATLGDSMENVKFDFEKLGGLLQGPGLAEH